MSDTDELLDSIIEAAIFAEYNEVVSIETSYFNEIVASLE